jgi:hypothetical protein
MSMKLMITTAAVLAVLAGPVLAGDHDLETELRDSGRYVPQANLPETKMKMPRANLQSGFYASAVAPARPFSSRSFVRTPTYDFQLDGR